MADRIKDAGRAWFNRHCCGGAGIDSHPVGRTVGLRSSRHFADAAHSRCNPATTTATGSRYDQHSSPFGRAERQRQERPIIPLATKNVASSQPLGCELLIVAGDPQPNSLLKNVAWTPRPSENQLVGRTGVHPTNRLPRRGCLPERFDLGVIEQECATLIGELLEAHVRTASLFNGRGVSARQRLPDSHSVT